MFTLYISLNEKAKVSNYGTDCQTERGREVVVVQTNQLELSIKRNHSMQRVKWKCSILGRDRYMKILLMELINSPLAVHQLIIAPRSLLFVFDSV